MYLLKSIINNNNLFGHYRPPSTYQSMKTEPAAYMALRSTTTDGLSDYDNPNKGAHGYDIPKGSLRGYEVPKNQTNRAMPGKTIVNGHCISNTVRHFVFMLCTWCKIRLKVC